MDYKYIYKFFICANMRFAMYWQKTFYIINYKYEWPPDDNYVEEVSDELGLTKRLFSNLCDNIMVFNSAIQEFKKNFISSILERLHVYEK